MIIEPTPLEAAQDFADEAPLDPVRLHDDERLLQLVFTLSAPD